MDAYFKIVSIYSYNIIPGTCDKSLCYRYSSLGKLSMCQLENFLLMLKERHCMSQTAISFAIESVKKFIYTCDHLKASASAAGVNINAEDIDLFYGLETEYFQTKQAAPLCQIESVI